jgi:eukaryotic-like serine/threonine-protein kinase
VTQNEQVPGTPGRHSVDGPGVTDGHSVMTMSTSAVGELLGKRYRLEEHINDDGHGREVWRGLDVILRRPVAIVLRHPGGAAAGEMLSAAVSASRIVHPHMVDVYDAVDEETRAYIVREWVDGTSLRDLVADGPLDTVRATAIAHAIASAVAAAHASGMIHGNVHPGTVLVADDGRVILADARADESASHESDVRSVGAVLYCALTGHWPHAEAGVDRLPDAHRDSSGALPSPRQVRGGLPSYLSELATNLLNPDLAPPTADQLSIDLGRLDTEASDEFYGEGPLGFASLGGSRDQRGPGRSGRKLIVGAVALLVIAAGGVFLAKTISSSPGAQAAAGPTTSSTLKATTPTPTPISGNAVLVGLSADSVRIVETKGGETELANAARMVDGNPNSYWKSSWYNSAHFGNLKDGIGVLLDLGSVRNVTNVQVSFITPGATVEAYIGDTDPGLGTANGTKLLKAFKHATDAGPQVAGANIALPIGVPTRYVLLWVTSLPPAGTYSTKSGTYLFGIDEVSVYAR